MKIIEWFEDKIIYYKMAYILYGILSVTILKEIPYLTTIFSISMVLLSFVYFCVFLMKGYYFKMSKIRYLLIAFLMIQLSTFFVSKNYMSDFIRVVFNGIFFFIISISTNKERESYNINKIFRFLVNVIFPIVFLSLATYYFNINFKINNNIYGNLEEYDLATKTLLGVTVNINTLGILCAFLIIISVHLIISEKQNIKMKIYLVLVTFIGSLTLFHTEARGAIITLLVYIFMILTLSIKNKVNMLKVMFVSSLFVSLIGLKIICSTNIEKLSTGRSLLWKSAWNVIKENPIWGVGTTAYVDILKSSSTVYLPGIEAGGLHNIYIQIATSSGCIAFIIFIFFILISIAFSVKKILFNNDAKYKILNTSLFSIIVSLLILNLFESSLIYIMSFIALIFWVCLGELFKNIGLE